MTDQPPRIPPELHELDRAVALLGSWANGATLRQGTRLELVALLGRLPSGGSEVVAWKKSLKNLRREVAAEPDPEATLGEEA